MTVTTQLTSKRLKLATVIFTVLMFASVLVLFFGEPKNSAAVVFCVAGIGRVVVSCLTWWHHA